MSDFCLSDRADVPAVGNPGLAFDVEGLPGLLSGGSVDTVLDWGVVGNLGVRAASVRGREHRYESSPRQDAFYLGLANDKAGRRYLLLSVADGVGGGGLKFSHIASREAANRSIGLLSEAIAEAENGVVQWQPLMVRINEHIAGVARDVFMKPDWTAAHASQVMATTLVLAVIAVEPDEGAKRSCRIASIGDSCASILRRGGTWENLNEDGDKVDGRTQALPVMGQPEFTEALFSLVPGDVFFLFTDGVTEPLQAESVRAVAAGWWKTLPAPHTFGAQVDFGRRTHSDDRTAIGVWLPATGEIALPKTPLGEDESCGTEQSPESTDYEPLDLVQKLSVEAKAYTEAELEKVGFVGNPGIGATALVYRLANSVGGRWLAYKKFKTAPGNNTVVHFERLVKQLQEWDGRGLAPFVEQHMAWPLAVVTENGAFCGTVMNYIEFKVKDIAASRETDCDLGILCRADSQILKFYGISISTKIRLELMAQLASVFSFLHKEGFVYGDLNHSNVLWTSSPAPRCVLIDCDVARKKGWMGFKQTLETEGWKKEGAPAKTDSYDVWKLSLAVLRVLSIKLSTQRVGDRIEDYNSIVSGVSAETVKLLQKVLLHDDRTVTAEDLEKQLLMDASLLNPLSRNGMQDLKI